MELLKTRAAPDNEVRPPKNVTGMREGGRNTPIDIPDTVLSAAHICRIHNVVKTILNSLLWHVLD
jgi:hypothetical protein